MPDQPDEKAGGESPPDLRHTAHEEHGIRVNRDLSGGGHLTRGDRTNMSRLNFSARAQPREQGDDPAFRDRPLEKGSAAPDSPTPAAAEPAAAAGPSEDTGIIGKVARFLGL